MIPHIEEDTSSSSGKPRASGDDPAVDPTPEVSPDVNPARAGMILTLTRIENLTYCKPRASGDDPAPSGLTPTPLS